MNVDEQIGDIADQVDAALAARFRQLRIARELSQTEVADRMIAAGFHWTPNRVAMVEAGRRRLKLAEVFSLALCLGATIQEVFSPGSEGTSEQSPGGGWSFASSYVLASLSAADGVSKRSRGFEVAGQQFDTAQDTYDFISNQAELVSIERRKHQLESYFSEEVLPHPDVVPTEDRLMKDGRRIRAAYVGPHGLDWLEEDLEHIRGLSESNYGHDVLTERNNRLASTLTESGGAGDVTALLGHITRQMARELRAANESADPESTQFWRVSRGGKADGKRTTKRAKK